MGWLAEQLLLLVHQLEVLKLSIGVTVGMRLGDWMSGGP
jgi:hypothetical protein